MNAQSRTPLELGSTYCSNHAIRLNKESPQHLLRYIQARQVPMGKAVCSDILLSCMEEYSNDTIFYVGVFFAGMVPKNEPQTIETLREIMKRAMKECEKAGMLTQFDYPTLHLFNAYATKRQLLEMTCSSDAALYFFACTGLL